MKETNVKRRLESKPDYRTFRSINSSKWRKLLSGFDTEPQGGYDQNTDENPHDFFERPKMQYYCT